MIVPIIFDDIDFEIALKYENQGYGWLWAGYYRWEE